MGSGRGGEGEKGGARGRSEGKKRWETPRGLEVEEGGGRGGRAGGSRDEEVRGGGGAEAVEGGRGQPARAQSPPGRRRTGRGLEAPLAGAETLGQVRAGRASSLVSLKPRAGRRLGLAPRAKPPSPKRPAGPAQPGQPPGGRGVSGRAAARLRELGSVRLPGQRRLFCSKATRLLRCALLLRWKTPITISKGTHSPENK